MFVEGELVGNLTDAMDWAYDSGEFTMNFDLESEFKFDILIQEDGDVYVVGREMTSMITLDIKALNLKV